MKKTILSLALGVSILVMSSGCQAGTTCITQALPTPDKSGGVAVMQAISKRHTDRQFDMKKPISAQILSDLLWSAWGISREDGKRTVPTAKNLQEMELYVVKEDGTWRYIAEDNVLLQISDRDLRVGQMKNAPLSLVFVGGGKFADMHAGSMYQNAGLCAASHGLGNVVLYSPVQQLQGTFPVKDGYKVIVAQSFGWAK